MTLLDLRSRYFEILAKVLSFRAALRQQALLWSLMVKRLSMMTSMDRTDFSGLSLVLTNFNSMHYNDVIMGTIESQITSFAIVYSTVYSDADQRKHQSSASLLFCAGNSPHKWLVTRKMFPFDDVIMVGWRNDPVRCEVFDNVNHERAYKET